MLKFLSLNKMYYKILMFFCLILSSCAYQFSNLNVKIPTGIKTIAIESVYDTSREVVPHEILWESVQKAFAMNGHLRVTSRERADAIVKMHLTSVTILPYGTSRTSGADKDAPYDQEAAVPPKPEKYRILPQGRTYTQVDKITATLDVEIYDINLKKVIFKKNYKQSEQLTSAHYYSYQEYDEAIRADFKRISDNIAENMVKDFIYR